MQAIETLDILSGFIGKFLKATGQNPQLITSQNAIIESMVQSVPDTATATAHFNLLFNNFPDIEPEATAQIAGLMIPYADRLPEIQHRLRTEFNGAVESLKPEDQIKMMDYTLRHLSHAPPGLQLASASGMREFIEALKTKKNRMVEGAFNARACGAEPPSEPGIRHRILRALRLNL